MLVVLLRAGGWRRGWAPGRYVYRMRRQIALHGGRTSCARVADEHRGEDPATAGRRMLAVHIGDRSRSSSYEGLEFGPITPGAPR